MIRFDNAWNNIKTDEKVIVILRFVRAFVDRSLVFNIILYNWYNAMLLKCESKFFFWASGVVKLTSPALLLYSPAD